MIAFLILFIDMLTNIKLYSCIFIPIALFAYSLAIDDINEIDLKKLGKTIFTKYKKYLFLLLFIIILPSKSTMYTAMGLHYLTDPKNIEVLDKSRELLLLKVEDQINEFKGDK